MNYSLTGKARRAAKNTMQSKQVRAANVANYANREKTRTIKAPYFSATGFCGDTEITLIGGSIDRSKTTKVM